MKTGKAIPRTANPELQPLEEWEKKLTDVLLNIRNQFLKLGETLYLAQKELSAADYKKLLSYVEQYSLKDADIKSSIAAFLHTRPDLGTEEDHRIDPALVFAGAKNSKILFMDEHDQKRLLSTEKFKTVMSNGKIDREKTWSELSEVQRNTLIGKGGKILTINDQMDQIRGKKNAAIYPLGSIEAQKSGITFSGREGLMNLKGSFTEVAKMILESVCWDQLQAAVEEIQEESEEKVG